MKSVPGVGPDGQILDVPQAEPGKMTLQAAADLRAVGLAKGEIIFGADGVIGFAKGDGTATLTGDLRAKGLEIA